MSTRRISHPDILKEWRAYLEAERDIAYTTVSRYYLHVSNWLSYLGKKRKHFTLATREDAATWWRSVKQSYSTSSCVQVLCGLRQFYDWATNRGWYDGANWWHNFERPRVVHSSRPVISEEDMYRLLSASALDTWQNIRNRTIVAFLYGTGLRVSECARLSVHELDLRHRVCHVIGKGRRVRKQPIPAAIIPALEEWLEIRAMRADGTGALFINRSGKRLGPQGIRDATKAWCREVNLPNLPMNPHVLRKSACTHIYENGRDIRAVQRFAGHVKVETTEIYIASSDSFTQEIVETQHPLSIWQRRVV